MFYNKGDLEWFYIKSLHSGMVLEATGGHGGNVKTSVKVERKARRERAQLWTWRGNCIVNKQGLVLDINRGSSSSEAKVIAWSHHGGKNQQWKMVGNKIISLMHGMCLDIPRGSRSKDVDIIVFPVHGSVNRVDNQAWVLKKI